MGDANPFEDQGGCELFYRTGQGMVVVSIETDPTFTPGRPEVLFWRHRISSSDLIGATVRLHHPAYSS